MNLDGPFLVDEALTRGLLSREMAQSTAYPRLYPRVAVPARRALTMALRGEAAGLVHHHGVVAGTAAAALHRAVVSPLDVTVDLIVDTSGVRETAGLRRRRLRLDADEITVVGTTRVTTPARTAYDVARWLPRGEAVVVLDALFHATGLGEDDVRAVVSAHPDDRDRSAVEPVLEWLDARSGSPSASRGRVGLLARGIPRALVRPRLFTGNGHHYVDLALAWPETRTGLSLVTRVAAPARDLGWEVVETSPAGLIDRIDGVAAALRRHMDRWNPPTIVGGRHPWLRLPPPPDPDGWCDGGRSQISPWPP